ncbi:iron complex outermembrane recepter protein [Microbulbifer donghaiensis]|uniref:Iron complex outermembrane recepter protein n=1 Tax=Microbulbifer donghaiensis TaxID=494016 RepID=A0A1M4YNM5_9GAMM|nr:TonB-dependent receptor [Microbulbifer donghaiensis]SHF07341.1 iron complex outermembrane recepter protein [Microbulbifer donghaiensis]
MRYTKTTLALAISLVSSAVLAADERIEEEVVVTASRTEKPLSSIPNTVTLIDEAELTQQMAATSDLSTILGNLIPSFSPSRQKMTSSGESLRGRKPLYLIDGVPQSNPLRDGGRDGHTIDPLMLERVEVIHGANAIHGMGASGGIINLVTRTPGEDFQQSVRIESALQPDEPSDTFGYNGSYSISGKVDAVDVLASVSYRSSGINYDANGDIVGFDNTQGDTMDSDSINAFIKTGYSWDDQRVQLTVNHYLIEGNNNWLSVDGDIDAGIPTTAIEADVPGKSPSNEVTTINLQYTNEEILGQKLRVQVFSQDFAGTYGGTPSGTFQDPAYGAVVFDQSQNNSEKRGVKLTLIKDQIAGAPVSLAYGVDLLEDETWQQLILTGRAWVPPTQYKNIAPYAQAEFTGIDRLTVTAGVRHEISELKVDDFTTLYSYNGGQFVKGGNPEFSETLGNIGATYTISNAWRVYANYSEGFSMPDVGRVLRGINQPDQDVESFLDLQPILTKNRELGVDFSAEKFAAQLAYYTSDSDFGQRLALGSDGIYSVSREQTEIDGVELRGQWFASDSDTLEARYAYTKGRYDSDDDGKVDTDLDGRNIAPNRFNLSWVRNWTDAFSTRLQANWLLDRDFENSAGEVTTEFDGYTIIDASAQLQALGGEFALGIQNLTNEDYFTYYSQTAGNDTRNFKGLGRNVNLSYSRLF